jgi:hypothetical protein
MGLVVLDKSFLVDKGGQGLRDSLGNHTVLVTHELLYEVATDSKNRPPGKQLDKLARLDVVQSVAIFRLLGGEICLKLPTSDIVDHAETARIRFCLQDAGMPLNIQVPDPIRPLFEHEPVDRFREAIDRMWDEGFDDVFRHANADRAAGCSDAEVYCEIMTQLSAWQIGQLVASRYQMNAVIDQRWMLYWFERLRNFLAFRWRLNGTRAADLSHKVIANELMDIYYVTLMPWADGIATCERGLHALVNSFFPRKLILS